jgi:toxin ParE1/3/4
MKVRLLPAARKELDGAIDYHEAARPGYGIAFLQEYEYAVQRVAADPDSFANIKRDYRSISLRVFPYSLVYRRESDSEVVIVAVSHAKRRSGYWWRRVSKR